MNLFEKGIDIEYFFHVFFDLAPTVGECLQNMLDFYLFDTLYISNGSSYTENAIVYSR